MMSYTAAQSHALLSGATQDEIDAEAARQARHRGTSPQRNMIRALQLSPWRNDRDDWVRLAGALKRG
jgi:hypothetical protein